MLKHLFGQKSNSELKGSKDPHKSPAHLLLLSKFREPQDTNYFAQDEFRVQGWQSVLGEPPSQAIAEFIRNGLITKADLNGTLIAVFTSKQLKDELKSLGQKQIGSKTELVGRLIAANKDRAQSLADGKEVYQCTELGFGLAEPFIQQQDAERAKAETESLDAVRANDLKRAGSIVGDFESRQVFKRGINVDWMKYPSQQDINRLQLLQSTGKNTDESVAAIMIELWGVSYEDGYQKWLPGQKYRTASSTQQPSTPEQIEIEARNLEHDLPMPVAFTQLISFYRKVAKEAKRSGNNQIALNYYNRMFSLSKLWHTVYGPKKSGISGLEVDQAEGFLKRFKKENRTYYCFTFADDGAIPNDVLLSPTDYKFLQQLSNSQS